MHDRIIEWHKKLDLVTKQVSESLVPLTADELNTRPAPDKWSIAQILDHLIVINSSYFEPIEKLMAGKYELPWIGKINAYANFMGKTILQSVKPENARKARTFGIWEPAIDRIDSDIIDRFIGHQKELKAVISNSEGLLVSKVKISSPANRFIVYPLEMAFEIIVTHEHRHLEQCLDLKQQIASG